MAIDFQAVLQFDRDLQRTTTLTEVVRTTAAAIEKVAGYKHSWILLIEPGPPAFGTIIGGTPEISKLGAQHAQRLRMDGDPVLREILAGQGPVVVEDARIDPRTDKSLVERIGTRTAVSLPILVGDERLGSVGTGTIGDEGPRPPTPEQLEQLAVMATQLGGALRRVKLLEAQNKATHEHDELKRRMATVQRVESLALLAGGVAHDFNNLLTVITNNLHLLSNDPLTPGQTADLNDAIEATKRAAGVTRQLLALARKQPLKFESLDINGRITSMVQLLRRLVTERIEIDFVPGASLPQVLVDGPQLDQVVMNLCLNARDAMPSGGRLTLETQQVVLNGQFIAAHPWARAGRYILLSVTDTGNGMPPEVLERVFEPFFTTKPVGEGTGLGLALAMGIVEQHGGLLHGYSEVGVGTTFKVYLPVHMVRAVTVGPRLEGAVPRGSERILLAEDDDLVRESTRRLLTQAGYTVVVARDGQEALELATDTSFDLVLLDTVMPRLNGREAFERILVLRPHTRFLFASGYAADVLPQHFLSEHGLMLLPKPYDPDSLLRAIRRVLS